MSVPDVGGDVVFGRKRRLPAWMSGVGSSPVKSRVISEGEDPNGRSSHAPTFEATKSTEDTTVSEKVVVENGKRRRPKRSYKNHTTDLPSLVDSKKRGSKNNGMDEVKSKTKDGTLRSKNLKLELGEAKEKLTPSKSEDANHNQVELTVEDLISIAQEYVSTLDGSTRESKCKGMPSTSSFLAKSNSKESYGEAGTRRNVSSKSTRVTSLSDRAEADRCVNAGPELMASTDIPRTGDAAQDMLDVFLGALLQKVDVGDDTPITDDLIFGSESNKPATNEAGEKKVEVHLEKKKSSLKDKVAMFLD